MKDKCFWVCIYLTEIILGIFFLTKAYIFIRQSDACALSLATAIASQENVNIAIEINGVRCYYSAEKNEIDRVGS